MPSKYPILSSKEVLSKLSRLGFFIVSQKGSHVKLSDGQHVVIVPMHDEIARGTLKSILVQAGVLLNDFIEV